MFHFANYTSSLEPAVESSVDSFSAMCQCAPLSWKNTLGVSSSNASETGSSPGFRCGTMSEPSMASPGEGLPMSYAAAGLVRTSQQPGKASESRANAQASGLSLYGSLARYDLESASWKIPQCSLLGDWDEFSETWPRWGTMRNGVCWARMTLAPPTAEKESGYLPTPNASDHIQRKTSASWKAKGRVNFVLSNPEITGVPGGMLNPEWTEWLLGWPIGWSVSGALGMGKFLPWLRAHSALSTSGLLAGGALE